MKKTKVTLLDGSTGRTWEKEGDFGVVAIADRQKGGGPMVEVDFSSASETDISFLLATMLHVAYQTSPKIAQYAIVLFSQKINQEKKL